MALHRFFVLFLLYTWSACLYGTVILCEPFVFIMSRKPTSLWPALGSVGSQVSQPSTYLIDFLLP